MKTTVHHIKDAIVGEIGKVTYIGRAGKGQDGYFGNPHPIGYCNKCLKMHDRNQCVKAYKEDFLKRIDEDPEFKRRILELKGHILLCFCAPQLCHGHVIAEWLEAQP